MKESLEERIRFANEEIIRKGNIAIIDEVFLTDYLAHIDGEDYRGLEEVRGFVDLLRSTISDLQIVEVSFLNHSDDKITWLRTLSGTHKADVKGIPATKQNVEWREMLVTRFEGDKIAEEWLVSELLGQLLLTRPRS